MLLLALLSIACNRFDQFGLDQRCNHCRHLVIGVMHQLNSLGGTFSRARPAALAGRRLDVCRAYYVPGSNQVRFYKRNLEGAYPQAGKAACAQAFVHHRDPATHFKIAWLSTLAAREAAAWAWMMVSSSSLG